MKFNKLWAAANGWLIGMSASVVFAQATGSALAGNFVQNMLTLSSGPAGRGIVGLGVVGLGVQHLADPAREHLMRKLVVAGIGGSWVIFAPQIAQML